MVRQAGGFRSHALLPTEWSTIWHQLPCRLRVYANQIEEGWAEGTQHEYGAGPAELQALQGMAAKWWQDVQHIHCKAALPQGDTSQSEQLWVNMAGEAQFLEGQWENCGTHDGSPVWKHIERHLHMFNVLPLR